MSEVVAQEEGPEIVSAFPLPPAHFVLYKDGVDSGPSPPEPMQPTYHMFGTPYSTLDVVPDLLPQPGQKLYLPSVDSSTSLDSGDVASDASGSQRINTDQKSLIDYKMQMKKINHSLLANFMELIDILIKKPSLFNEKLNDLELLFLNMHNLINTFRPHQARETIIHMLKTQIQDRRDAAQEIRRTIDAARSMVEEKHSQLQETQENGRLSSNSDVKMESVENEIATDLSSSSAASGSASQTQLREESLHSESTQRAQEVQQMQEAFFTALSNAMVPP